MTESPPNLRVLQPSRKAVRQGDIFTFSPAPDTYLFGRVMATDADAAFGPPVQILIYIYDTVAETPDLPDESLLRPDRLLVPPIFINRLPWSRGYFQTLQHRELTSADRLPINCFEDIVRKGYYDEHGHKLPGPVEPLGLRALASFRVVDDLVCKRLGIPLAPD